MASIEQWKLSRAWTIWDEARDPDGADEHIERTCTNLCQSTVAGPAASKIEDTTATGDYDDWHLRMGEL